MRLGSSVWEGFRSLRLSFEILDDPRCCGFMVWGLWDETVQMLLNLRDLTFNGGAFENISKLVRFQVLKLGHIEPLTLHAKH